VLLFILILWDSNPERAENIKKKLPVASFLVFSCADGYREQKRSGRQAVKAVHGFSPITSSKIKRSIPQGVLLFILILWDSNPERAENIKKKLPVASFLVGNGS
jgi:predicted dehydrogenase